MSPVWPRHCAAVRGHRVRPLYPGSSSPSLPSLDPDVLALMKGWKRTCRVAAAVVDPAGRLCLCVSFLNPSSVNRCRLWLLFQHRKCTSDASPGQELSWAPTGCCPRGSSGTQQSQMWTGLLQDVLGRLNSPFCCAGRLGAVRASCSRGRTRLLTKVFDLTGCECCHSPVGVVSPISGTLSLL